MLQWIAKSITVLLMIGACIRLPPAWSSDIDRVDLDQIAHRLTQWRISFHNLRVVYELKSLPPTDEPVVDWTFPPPDPESASLFSRDEWISGEGLDLFESRFISAKSGTTTHRSMDVFNRPMAICFQARYRQSPDGPEDFKELNVQAAGTERATSSMARSPVTGLYWPTTAQWLPELFVQWAWKLDGFEDIGGTNCAKIVATHAEITKAPLVEMLWLDLAHDCLVRRYRCPPVPGRRLGSDFIVDELKQLETGIWFPKRGRLQMQATPNVNQLFVVTDVEVNRPLDMTRFEPPTPQAKTLIIDRDGRLYGPGVALLPQATTDTRENKRSTSRSPADSPGSSPWLRSLGALVCIVIALVIIGGRFSAKR